MIRANYLGGEFAGRGCWGAKVTAREGLRHAVERGIERRAFPGRPRELVDEQRRRVRLAADGRDGVVHKLVELREGGRDGRERREQFNVLAYLLYVEGAREYVRVLRRSRRLD
jgi:hypothetical protein